MNAAALSVAVATAFVAAVVSLVLALPIAVWWLKRRELFLPDALLFGIALGNVPHLVMAGLWGTHGTEGLWRGMAFSTVLGVAGATVFWAIVAKGPRLFLRSSEK